MSSWLSRWLKVLSGSGSEPESALSLSICGVDIPDSPGTALLLFRRDAFAYRCYGAYNDMALPDELRLRRILSEEFEALDLLSGPWTRRIPGCRAAALRLAADARERAAQEEEENFAMLWQDHAEWLEWWAVASIFAGFRAG